MAHESSSDRQHSKGSEAAERTAALALWAVVGAALVYGVAETGVRVAQLFA